MKLIDYMPPFLQEIKEFKLIFNAEDKELENLNKEMNIFLKECFIETANSYGVNRYEKIYNVKNTTNDIEIRKFNILSKINNRIPFTKYWLENKLNSLVGKDNYRLYIDYANYKVEIDVASLFTDIAVTLSKSLREQIPANMIIEVNLFQTEMANMYVGAIMRAGKYIKIGSEEVG